MTRTLPTETRGTFGVLCQSITQHPADRSVVGRIPDEVLEIRRLIRRARQLELSRPRALHRCSPKCPVPCGGCPRPPAERECGKWHGPSTARSLDLASVR